MMGNERLDQIVSRLRESGHKVTDQRRRIIGVLLNNLGRHLNVRQLYDMVREHDANIGFATVYRTIEILLKLNVVTAAAMGEGFSRYEILDDRTHFHLVCLKCGKVVHLSDDEIKETMIISWGREAGFSVVPQALQIFGLCPDCSED